MNPNTAEVLPLSPSDQEELAKIVNRLELDDGAVTIFAVAPESNPNHPVVKQLLTLLGGLDEAFHSRDFFFSRDTSLVTFLDELDETDPLPPGSGRRLIMAFGLEQLPPYRLVHEMQELNLARERIFSRKLVLIFWLNRARFLDEFANRAPDFWDWRGKAALFETRPPLDPQLHPHQLFYPYLEELRDENSHLKVSGVMQVQRQVDILLDQIYVSLQAEWRKQVTETVVQHDRELLAGDVQSVSKADDGSGLSSSASVQPSFDKPGKPDGGNVEVTSKTVTEKIDLAKVVRDYQYSVILGAPGAGKTTLLRYLALHFAKAVREERSLASGSETQEDLGNALIPLLFRIADYAEQLKQQNNLSLLDYLCQFYRQKTELVAGTTTPQISDAVGVTEAAKPDGETVQDCSVVAVDVSTLLLEEIRQGHCLILLDGLDEVFDRENRKLIVQHIEQFVEAFAANKFVITSRIAGYQDARLGDRFHEFTITDMGEEQVSQFLHRWCRAIERAQQPDASDEQCQLAGEREAAAILTSIQGNEGVKRLTTNPLLLTILALIHRNGTMLPHRRVELYALAVKTLTETWQVGRNAAYNDTQLAALRLRDAELRLREREVVELLAPLAYWMHEHKPTGAVPEGEAKQQLIQSLADLRDVDLDSPEIAVVQQDIEEFLRTVRETTGLFVERAPDLYGFMHLTFEEYFAALQIAGNGTEMMLETIQQRLYEPRWEEPILLALGFYSIYNSQKQVSKLLEQLFSGLAAYQPMLLENTIKLRNPASTDAMLVWSSVANSAETRELPLKDLLLAGQVAAQVEFKINLRKQWIEKLLVTGLALPSNSEGDTRTQILRLLRQIESFNQQGEVVAQLVRIIESDGLTEELRATAQATLLYVVCGQTSANLVRHIAELTSQLDPALFWIIKQLVAELGEEITPHLEEACSYIQPDELENQQAVGFLTAVSYMRSGADKKGADHYDTAISRLQSFVSQPTHPLTPYLALSLATCYREKKDYRKAEEYYRECDAQFANFIFMLRERGECQRLYGKYAMALESFQKMYTLAQEFRKPEDEADAAYCIGQTYVDWGKYAQAITHYERSRDQYAQMGEESDVADLHYWLGDCYKDWGKYEQALESQQKELEIRLRLDDQANVARAEWRLGKIYQAWNKYEEAITQYQKSRDLYEQLSKQKNVANQWNWLGKCYEDWGKYEQAVECQKQCIVKRQELGDQVDIALSYDQLGDIYRAWKKYEEAIAYYEKSRSLYKQLGREKNVANQWYYIADCYCDWGKYEQALEAENEDLAIREKLADRSNIADAYYQFGRIHQSWSKHEQAIAYYEKSRDFYEQIEQLKNVAGRWYDIAECYRILGKYEQSLGCQQRCLEIRQRHDNPLLIAASYYQLGSIYKAWGKHEIAIAHQQESLDLYVQLDKEANIANQWNNLAACYRDWSKYAQALECEFKALDIRQKLGSQFDLANAYNLIGITYHDWGKYKQAISYYQESCKRLQSLDRDRDVAILCHNLANCYRDWGRYELAIETTQQCLQIRQKLNDQSGIASAYHRLGRIYQVWSKYSEAIAKYQQSRELYQQLDNEKEVAGKWDWLSACYREWGKFSEALECAQKYLEIVQLLENQSEVASAYCSIGYVYQGWGKYREAIAVYEQSRELYQQLGKEADVANQWGIISDCHRDWEHHEQALEAIQQCLVMRQQLDDQSGVAQAHYRLGRIYHAWSTYEEAIAAYEHSRELYKQLGKEPDVANQWGVLSDCYRDWRCYKQALEAVQQCLKTRQQLDDQSGVAQVHCRLGLIYQAWGKYGEAIAAYEQSRELYRQLDKESDVANQWGNLADCYQEWGRYDQALEATQQCLQMHQKLDDQSGIAQAHYQLGRIFRAWGKYADAIAYHKQSLTLYEKLELETDIADQWDRIAYCYFQWGKYELAAEFQQQCLNLYQILGLRLDMADAFSWLGRIYRGWHQYDLAMDCHVKGLALYQKANHKERAAIQFRLIAYLKRYQAKAAPNSNTALDLLFQANYNLQQALQLDNAGNYKQNLAYDHIVLALLAAECLRHLPNNDLITTYITQFEQSYQTGLTLFTELGQTVKQADETLSIARTYLEVGALENYDRAEELARQSLQTFQEYNRRKLEAAALKLLGEIYLARAKRHQPDARETAIDFLESSLQIYRELDLEKKTTEVEQLMQVSQ